MYEHMAGIVPTSAGYATVDVKPQISKTLGPSSVNAGVKTVRNLAARLHESSHTVVCI